MIDIQTDLEDVWVDPSLHEGGIVCYFPSSPLGSDCTNLSPHMRVMFLSLSLSSLMGRPVWTAQKTVTFAQEQKVYFVILCNNFHCKLTDGRAASWSVCLSFSCLFIQFSQHAWLSATLLLCVTGKFKVQPDYFHWAALLKHLESKPKCCLRVVVLKGNENVSLFSKSDSLRLSVQSRQPLNNSYAASIKSHHQLCVIRSKISLVKVQHKLFARELFEKNHM